MSLFKNEVGRPSNETIKKRNIFKGICVLLVLVIIGLVGYILNDKGIITFNKTSQNKNDNDKVVTTTKKEDANDMIENETVEISKTEAFNIYESVFAKFGFNTENLSYLNSNEYKTAYCISKTEPTSQYDSFELLKDKLKNYNGNYFYEFEDRTSANYVKGAKVYDYNDILNDMKNTFSGNIQVAKENLYWNQYRYVFVEEQNVFVRLETVWGDGGHQVIADVASASKIKDKVNIDILIADVEYIDENHYLYFSSDGDEIKLNNEDIKNYSETLKKYENKVKKYTLTFVENNDKYLFESIK